MTSPIDGHAKNFDQLALQQQPCRGHAPQGPGLGTRAVAVTAMVHLPVFVGRMLVGGPGSV